MTSTKTLSPANFLKLINDEPEKIIIDFSKYNTFTTKGTTIKYFNINIDGNPIRVCFKKARVYGKILPTTQAECLEMYGDKVTPRQPSHKPKFSICKYINLAKTDEGYEPISTDDTNIDPLFKAFSAFSDLVEKRIKQAIKQHDIDDVVRHRHTTSVPFIGKTCGFIQKSANNNGNKVPIVNEICRFTIDFSKRSPCNFYIKKDEDYVDYTLPDGSTNITNENVHHIFVSGQVVSGIITIDNVCAHNMGLSYTPKLTMCIVNTAKKIKNTDDLALFLNDTDEESTDLTAFDSDDETPIVKARRKQKNKVLDDIDRLTSQTQVLNLKESKPVKKIIKKEESESELESELESESESELEPVEKPIKIVKKVRKIT